MHDEGGTRAVVLKLTWWEWQTSVWCYASQQTYVKVNDTYSEGGTHKETLRPQSKARVMNKRQGDKVTIRWIVDL